MSDFLKDLVSELGTDFGTIANERLGSAEFTGFVDTGCYLFNAVLSGSIFGGLPNNKITAIAGEPATGKTFFALGIIKHFLDSDKKASVIYFDTEAAVNTDMLEDRGIDSKRVLISEPDTIQNFRTKAIKMIDSYEAQPEAKRGPLLMVLDSLGMLSTTKELEDTAEGKETRDMTKAAVIKATFRVLTLRLARAKVPLIVTNHVYAAVGAYVPTNVMSGGCLVAGTKILTDKGLLSIEEFKGGEKVFTKEQETHEVLQTHITKKEIIQIQFEDGYVVKCSPEHKFLIDGNWVEAKDLLEGNLVSKI